MEYMTTPTIHDIRAAHKRIKAFIHRTPVLSSQSINSICKAQLFFKCENMQKVGAFKFRGATNAVQSLNPKQAKKGVATHSSGNHAAALTCAAGMIGIPAYIVMPKTAPQIKKEAVKGYGAVITYCEPTQKSREETLDKVVEETGAEFVHPYNDYRVITGQATAALELIEEIGNPDIIMTPVGGGGLLSGTCLSTSALSPRTAIYAAEPKGADDAFRSLNEGRIIPSINPVTIADGLLTSLGDKTYPIIKEHVKEIITVSEENIIQAMRLIWERMKIIVEPSAAVPLGAVLEQPDIFKNRTVGIILSGGNVDLSRLPF
jgi:threonine dehydratase